MRPTFMGFETAKMGLSANQKAMDIVGHNTSNIGVTGYTRQRVDLVSLSTNMRYTRFSGGQSALAGQGAAVYGISQLRDSFLDKRFREEYSDVGYYNVTSAVLGDLHGAIDEIAPAHITDVLANFEGAWRTMMGKDMNEGTGATNLQTIATQMVQVFRQMSAKIDNVWNQQEYALKLDVNEINSKLERLAQFNEEIARANFTSLDPNNSNYQALELLDRRNVLLDELSGFADINYQEEADGQVTVWMGAKSDDNPPVVKGDKFEQLSMSVDDSDPMFKTASVYWNNTGKEVTFNTGSIRGALDMLNGRGLDMNNGRGETYNQGILYYKDKVDQFARTVAEAFNRIVEVEDPLNPGNGTVPPTYKQLFSFESDEFMGASNMKVSDEWSAGAEYLINGVLDKIVEGDVDNNYAAKALNIFEKSLDFGEFKGKINDYVIFYSTTKLSNDKSFADDRLEAVTSISEGLLNDIQNVSGVSMEEEGVEMMMYQKAFDAMSRVFTTLDEMLDKLINQTAV